MSGKPLFEPIIVTCPFCGEKSPPMDPLDPPTWVERHMTERHPRAMIDELEDGR